MKAASELLDFQNCLVSSTRLREYLSLCSMASCSLRRSCRERDSAPLQRHRLLEGFEAAVLSALVFVGVCAHFLVTEVSEASWVPFTVVPASPPQFLRRDTSVSLSLPLHFVVLYAVHLVSKQSSRSNLPRTSCFFS
jgi:hypothetical protein